MVTINQSKCIGCGKCVKDCVSANIIIKDSKASVRKDCFLCGHCVSICPVGAVAIPEYDMEDVTPYDKETFTLNPRHLLHSIQFRRSIRDYKNCPVEQDKLELILQSGRYTATAKNDQNNHFIFVQNELSTLKKIVWGYIDRASAGSCRNVPPEIQPYVLFNLQRKKNPEDDFLFRNAPAVVYLATDRPWDAGLAAQNMELMASSLGLGMLYNGFLARISDANDDLKKWLGIEGKTISACMLLGYPNVTYARTAPRKEAQVVWR